MNFCTKPKSLAPSSVLHSMRGLPEIVVQERQPTLSCWPQKKTSHLTASKYTWEGFYRRKNSFDIDGL